MADHEVADNIVTFIGTGHEKTALSVTWALSILAHLPEMQEALRSEYEAIVVGGTLTAEMFDPARFALDAPPLDPFAYLPFGGGPHTCIGAHLGLLNAIGLLGEVLRRVQIAPDGDREIEPILRVALRPRHGAPLHVTAL